MARCKDPSLSYLNDKGYNIVKLPRSGIEPLDVLGRDGATIERLGRLQQIWNSSSAAPEIELPRSASAVNGQQTSELRLSVGLKLLSDVLGAMGAAVPQLGFAYSNAKTLRFTFADVESVCVSPFSLGEFLADGDLKSNNPFVSRYFEDEGTDAYVIFEILRSKSIVVAGQWSSSTSVDIDVPAIRRQVGADIDVSIAGENTTTLTYTGRSAVTFGFKAFDIEFSDGKWQVQALAPSGNTSFANEDLVSDLDTRGRRVSIR
jgi:hypothetical protein